MNKLIYLNGRFLTQKLTGAQRNSYELVRHLVSIYTSQIIVLVPNEPVNSSYNTEGFPVKVIGMNKGVLWEQLDLPGYLAFWGRPLLINLTNTAPLMYRNQVVSIMDMTTFVNPLWFSRAFALYYQWLVPKIVRKARLVVTISESSKSDIIRYTSVSSDRIRVIYCAVSDRFLSLINTDDELEKALLERFKLRPTGFFLAVSSLDPRKNFVSLIKEYKQSGVQTIPLVIVGSGGKAFNDPEIEAYKTDKDLVFTGYLSDSELSILYKTALCFVYPSLYEGFGIPPLEAMACGCPTIVSNTSSLPEVCGQASYFIDPVDAGSIGAAMEKLSTNKQLRDDLIGKGRLRVNEFSWKKSAHKLATEIDLLLYE